MSMLDKIELKRQLQALGIKVEGNYVRKKDIETLITADTKLTATDYTRLRKKKNKTPYETGFVDGFEQPEDLTQGMTYDRVEDNEAYDQGVNDGQNLAKKLPK